MHRRLPEILMAEDSADDAELTIGALDEYNLANRVVLVGNGAEALDYLHRRGSYAGRTTSNPILLLLDLKMPKVNGLEVLRQMKESPELADIPVVMLSSSCEELDLKEAQSLGASAYVVKPVRFQDFVDAVKTIGKFWALLNVLRPGGIEAIRDIEVVPEIAMMSDIDTVSGSAPPA
jgi:two-component system, response regulator